MSTFSKRFLKIIGKLSDKAYRDAYVEAHIDSGLAFQIRDIRKNRGLTQAELADLINTKQASISRFEDPNYGKYTIESLKKMASVFDVALMVRFVPFSELARKTSFMNSEDIAVPAFSEDPGLRFQSQKDDVVVSIDVEGVTHSSQPVRFDHNRSTVTTTQFEVAL